MLVPGGFGSRGWEGKILACRVAREDGIPYLGICLGMHVAVSEFARHVVGPGRAPTRPRWTPRRRIPVIDLLPEQKEVEDLGGTMRLGAQAVELAEGTRTREAYGDEEMIAERHRHRYEVNNALPPAARSRRASSSAARTRRAASSRSSSCPTTRGSSPSQFHPEFKSRPMRPAPLFRDFVGAALERARARASRRRESRSLPACRCSRTSSTSSSSWRRSRARPARSGPSPTA